MHGLNTRDLRTIDSFRNQIPTILVRDQALVINLEHIKAIIKSDAFILIDAMDSEKDDQSLFILDLQEKLRLTTNSNNHPPPNKESENPEDANNGPNSNGSKDAAGQGENDNKDGTDHFSYGTNVDELPYELRAFEAVLMSVISVLRDQSQKLSPKVFSLLRKLETNSRIDRDTLFSVLDLSKRLTKFEARVNSVDNAIMELLNSDADMADMYLTEKKKTGKDRPTAMHEEVEFMLEYYAKQVEEIQSQTAQLISNIRTTQDIIKITLDSQRNSLLLLEIKIVMGSFAIASSTLIASMFGMNLHTGFETHPYAFLVVTGSIFVTLFTSLGVFARRFRRLVRAE